MITVAHLLKDKGPDIWSISPESSVYDAIALMAGKNVGALLVVDDRQLVGILSERDYARKVILAGKSSKETRVGDIMSTQVVHVHPEQAVEQCMEIMTDHRVRHLPVLEEGELRGIISIGDVVRSLLEDRQEVITHLENYISGGR